MKGLVMIVAAICVAIHVAAADVPSDADVRAVGKYVEELTKGDLAQMRQKKLTKEQYADALLGYAADEKKAAAKFALFRDAFKAYADAKSWEKADGVYGAAQVEGGTEYALAVVGHTTIPGAAKDLKARIEGDKKSYRQIGILKSKLKKTPDDESLCEALGQEYAAVGNWDGALASFLTAPGEVAKIADWELNKGGAYTAAKTAEFWWGYADGKPKSKMEALRLHAAMWYEIALGEGAYSGNEAKIVQGRIDETKSYGGAAMQEKATIAKQVKELKPIVLPLKGKTVIEFVGVPAGEFMMGTDDPKFTWIYQSLRMPHKVRITRPFWIAKYKVTKEVWGTYQNVELSNYNKATGGVRVPQCISYIEAMEFCERLTKKFKGKLPTGYIVRMPTEAEWEYALKIKDSGKDGFDFTWEVNISQKAWTNRDIQKLYENNGFDTSKLSVQALPPVEVGTKKPNGLGIYDMLGNGVEILLDTFDDGSFQHPSDLSSRNNVKQTGILYANMETDPLRYYNKVGTRYIGRGCLWHSKEPNPYAKFGGELSPVDAHAHPTLRLCIGPDLMKEKGYSFKSGKKK
jgi:formylglycine-generating enzyme required for sulfatase activity